MNTRNVILIHLAFWILFALIPELPIIFPDRKYPLYYYYSTFSTLTLNIINFYTAYFLISLNSLTARKIKVDIAKIVGVILLFFVFRLLMMFVVYVWFAGFDYKEVNVRFYHGVVEIYYTISFTLLAVFIKFMIDWFKTQKQKSELMARTKTSELALLRQQINPHFLFNTLNNLYSLVYKKSDEAPSVVMKLSDIMRYMLYDSNSDKVLLEKEIDYLESFIELNELRLTKGSFVQFDITGEVGSRLIPPMLLVPFVENAFKHGRKNYKLPGITILIQIHDSSLDFDIRNYINPAGNANKDQQGGIGLDNVRKRLDMIYPDAYDLLIEQTKEEFHVHLTIDRL